MDHHLFRNLYRSQTWVSFFEEVVVFIINNGIVNVVVDVITISDSFLIAIVHNLHHHIAHLGHLQGD